MDSFTQSSPLFFLYPKQPFGHVLCRICSNYTACSIFFKMEKKIIISVYYLTTEIQRTHLQLITTIERQSWQHTDVWLPTCAWRLEPLIWRADKETTKTRTHHDCWKCGILRSSDKKQKDLTGCGAASGWPASTSSFIPRDCVVGEKGDK